jgi:hypothetical protein
VPRETRVPGDAHRPPDVEQGREACLAQLATLRRGFSQTLHPADGEIGAGWLPVEAAILLQPFVWARDSGFLAIPPTAITRQLFVSA